MKAIFNFKKKMTKQFYSIVTCRSCDIVTRFIIVVESQFML